MTAADNAYPVVLHRRATHDDFHGAKYQDAFLTLRDGSYLDFPASFSIETLSLCNAACDFCPYPGLERKGVSMPDSLIEKILQEISDIGRRPPFYINLSRVNEPFLDSRVLDVSEEIERRFPEARNMFFSNGTPLTESILLRLSKLKQVDFLMISVNDHRERQYESVMRLPYRKTLARLHLINEMCATGLLPFQTYISRVGDGTSVDGEFLEWVKREYPALSGLVTVRGNWMGAVRTPIGPAPDVGCRQWFQLHVLANGRASFCGLDSDARHGIGDAYSQHLIHEIYNHPERRRLRTDVLSRLAVSACRGCSMVP
jgi:Radical SAM superfamily